MKRLTAQVSGNVQRVGYRARIMDLARAFSLKGVIQNIEDGRVKIIAEGEGNDLEGFLKAIDIKNTIIYVCSISKEYSEATGAFEGFYKMVGPGETDSRLDTAAVHLKELIVAVNKMNDNLGGKIDSMNKNLSGKIDSMNENLSGKMDKMLEKQDVMIEKQDATLGKLDDVRADIVGEIRELRRDFKDDLQPRIGVQLKQVQADIKAIKEHLGMS